VWDASLLDTMSRYRRSEQDYSFGCVAIGFLGVVSLFSCGATRETDVPVGTTNRESRVIASGDVWLGDSRRRA
jgi:hypothetical protein